MPTRPALAIKVDHFDDFRLQHFGPTGSVKEERAARWPYFATPKIDGIRCVMTINGPRTRSWKELPNEHVATLLADQAPAGLDGELLTLTNGEPDDFHTVQSKLMSQDGEPEFHFLCFDWCGEGWDAAPYFRRLDQLRSILQLNPNASFIKEVPVTAVYNATQLALYETQCLADGFEGVCFRTADAPYKSGRSTLTEQHLCKLKRFRESEAIITGYEELQRNTNEPTTSELGLLKRSKHQSGLLPANTLGALICQDPRTAIEFRIGSGFTAAQRAELWTNRADLPNKQVTYKHQPYGAQEAPRCPIFRGIRYDL